MLRGAPPWVFNNNNNSNQHVLTCVVLLYIAEQIRKIFSDNCSQLCKICLFLQTNFFAFVKRVKKIREFEIRELQFVYEFNN